MGLYDVCQCECVCVCVCKLSCRCPRVEEAENRPLLFLLQFVYASVFIRVDEGGSVLAQVKQPSYFFPFQSLLSLTDNGITHQRSFSLYPILLWPLQAFVHIHHNNSQPQVSASRLLIPRFPSPPLPLCVSGERLNLDENEIFISTQQLMAILIWYIFWCNISLLFFFITKHFFFLIRSALLWVILNTSAFFLDSALFESRIAKCRRSFLRFLEICLSHFQMRHLHRPQARRISGSVREESAHSVAR